MRLKKLLSLLIITVFMLGTIVVPAQASTYQYCNVPRFFSIESLFSFDSSSLNSFFQHWHITHSKRYKKPAPAPTPTPAPAPTPTPTPAPAPSPAPAPVNTAAQFEQRVVELVNVERQKAGLQPLVADDLLTKGATAKSQDMIDKNYFDHNSPTYGSPFEMMKAFGIQYTAAGENIAAGYSTPEAVVQGWMNSPGHRANILSTNYHKIGVGFAAGGSMKYYWTQWFTN